MSTFVKQGNQWVVKEGISENSSINDCLLALGYNHNQFYSYTNYNLPYSYDENGDNILNVCLKVMTEDIICVMTSPGRKSLTDADVQHYMQDFDYSLEYSLYSMESDLDSAIDEHNYTIQFVADTLGIPYSPDDKVLYSSKLKYNFIFDGGYLVGYEIADGLNREAHELKETGGLYNLIELHARNYHGSNDEAIFDEINIQSKAFYNLPSGMQNQFLPEFANADGSYNFKMLLVAKYGGTENEQGLSYEDCKCICHNELKFEGNYEEGLDKVAKYIYREYVLSFDSKGSLLSCDYYHNTSTPKIESSKNDIGNASGSGCMVTLFLIMTGLMSLLSLIFVI